MRRRPPIDDPERAVGPKGCYRLERPIGANRFASLWRGADRTTGEDVVLEVVRFAPPAEPAAAKALRDRMALTQDLPAHPSLSAVRSIHAPEPHGRLALGSRLRDRLRERRGIDTGAWLLVRDGFDGSTLEHRAAFGEMSPRALLTAMARVGEAVAALHAVGVAHGSLGATTVLVDAVGGVAVIDAAIGRSWHARIDTPEARADDVASLARLVAELVPRAHVPDEVHRALEEDADLPSLRELVLALRAAAAEVPEVVEPVEEEPVAAIDVPAVVEVPEPAPEPVGPRLETAPTLEELVLLLEPPGAPRVPEPVGAVRTIPEPIARTRSIVPIRDVFVFVPREPEPEPEPEPEREPDVVETPRRQPFQVPTEWNGFSLRREVFTLDDLGPPLEEEVPRDVPRTTVEPPVRVEVRATVRPRRPDPPHDLPPEALSRDVFLPEPPDAHLEMTQAWWSPDAAAAAYVSGVTDNVTLEPARWMRIAAVLITIVAFAAVAGGLAIVLGD